MHANQAEFSWIVFWNRKEDILLCIHIFKLILVWFYHGVWYCHAFAEFWRLHWLKTPGLMSCTFLPYSVLRRFEMMFQENRNRCVKKCPFSWELSQNFPPILLNFPPFLYVFLYFRGKISLQMSKFPGNQVPEFPTFPRL